MNTPHILIVEDDRDIGQLVAKYLKSNEMRVSLAENGRAMDRILGDTRISLIVLDRMLPGEDGLSICRRLRAASDIPIIILTAQADEIERIVGLEMGADDYLGKPFNPRELLARIRAVLRRNGAAEPKRATTKQIYRFAGWTMDCSRRRLTAPDDVRVELTMAEFNLLQTFVKSAGRVLTRDQLIELSGGDSDYSFDRSIDILVSRLRRKMEDDPKTPKLILTVRSGGYQFLPETTSE